MEKRIASAIETWIRNCPANVIRHLYKENTNLVVETETEGDRQSSCYRRHFLQAYLEGEEVRVPIDRRGRLIGETWPEDAEEADELAAVAGETLLRFGKWARAEDTEDSLRTLRTIVRDLNRLADFIEAQRGAPCGEGCKNPQGCDCCSMNGSDGESDASVYATKKERKLQMASGIAPCRDGSECRTDLCQYAAQNGDCKAPPELFDGATEAYYRDWEGDHPNTEWAELPPKF